MGIKNKSGSAVAGPLIFCFEEFFCGVVEGRFSGVFCEKWCFSVVFSW
jgi:hypothetical protein